MHVLTSTYFIWSTRHIVLITIKWQMFLICLTTYWQMQIIQLPKNKNLKRSRTWSVLLGNHYTYIESKAPKQSFWYSTDETYLYEMFLSNMSNTNIKIFQYPAPRLSKLCSNTTVKTKTISWNSIHLPCWCIQLLER